MSARNELSKNIDAYQRIVRSIAMRAVRSRETAEDAAQEAWLEVLKNMGSFRGQSKLSTWIYTVAYRIIIRHAKKERVLSTRFLRTYFHGEDRLFEAAKRGSVRLAAAGLQRDPFCRNRGVFRDEFGSILPQRSPRVLYIDAVSALPRFFREYSVDPIHQPSSRSHAHGRPPRRPDRNALSVSARTVTGTGDRPPVPNLNRHRRYVRLRPSRLSGSEPSRMRRSGSWVRESWRHIASTYVS